MLDNYPRPISAHFITFLSLELTGGFRPAVGSSFSLVSHSDRTELTKCLKDEGHDLSIVALLSQSNNMFPCFHLIRIEIEINDLGDNLREERSSGHNRRQNAASETIQSAVRGL